MIRVEEVCFSVAGPGGRTRPVLQQVSFSVDRGGLCVVTGSTGSGKSTLLHLLAGVLRPTAGGIWLDERPISRLSARHRDRARRTIGLLPQKLHLIEWLDVRGNVELPLVATPGAHRQRVAPLLEALDLARLAEQPAATLSGGERQRTALARALVSEAPLLVLDEPTAHQDDEQAARVLATVANAQAEGATVVVASHDPRVERWARASRAATQWLALRGGSIEHLEPLAPAAAESS